MGHPRVRDGHAGSRALCAGRMELVAERGQDRGKWGMNMLLGWEFVVPGWRLTVLGWGLVLLGWGLI